MSNRNPAFTTKRLLQNLRSLPVADAYIVGFSGGADSTALLHALCTVKHQLGVPFSAVHVNHGLHDEADMWQQQCETFCRQYEVKLTTLRIDLENRSGKGLEAEARHRRYQAIEELLTPGVSLLTAHHADDQAETLLLNLMRGSGVDGLSAMPESRPLGNGLLQRPMLEFQNSAILDYLREHDIDWVEDPSNQSLNHDRNFIRHEVIPLLEQRWPEIGKRLLHTRKAMTGARRLLEKLSNDYIRRNLVHPYVLELTPQIIDDGELFRLVIRRWLKRSGNPAIPVYRLEAFYEQARQAGHNPNVVVSWAGSSLHVFRQRLWLLPDPGIEPCPDRKWPTDGTELDLGRDTGLLVLERANHPVHTGPVTPGPRLAVTGRAGLRENTIDLGNHHKSLKKLFQEAGIPPWLRDCIPMCQLDGKLAAVGDWCISVKLESWLKENGVKICWRPNHPLLEYIRERQFSQTVDPAGAVR